MDIFWTPRLLKQVPSEAAGEENTGGVPSWYGEDFSSRERRWSPVSATGLELSNRALQDGHLSHGVAGGLEFRADLFFKVVGIADLVDEQVEKTFGGQQALRLELVEGLVAHRHIAAADVENDVVVAIPPEPFEP